MSQNAPQQLPFATEVQQILHLMIHSLYSKREVFLRELVSNASDALDTVRFLALTTPEIRPPEGAEIVLTIDKDKRTLSISDNGIGMTHKEVVEHIGTIARSGTGALLKEIKERANSGDASAPDLIGQFGVGFYSSFMVADRVELTTLSARPGAEAVHWVSEGGGTYTIEPGSRSEPGTTVTLHLKADADEFLEDWRIEGIVKEYSNFVKWPINLKGKAVNQSSALWAKRPAEVSEDDYNQFYRELTGGFGEDAPLAKLHIQMDAPYQFQAIVYLPKKAPFDFLMDQTKRRGMQLYVRRVFILDHAEELLPPYLRFLRGVVDSEDLPLNVSREILQKNQVITTIQKQIVKKTLDELKRLKNDKAETYLSFYEEFGSILKEGAFLDVGNKDKIADLLLFESRKTEAGKLISLAEYVAAMPEGQKEIYYITGTSRALVEQSPHLEALTRRGIDVLLLTEAIDEWVVQGVTEFSGKKLRSVTKGDLELPEIAEKDGADKDKEPPKDEASELLVGNLVTHLRVRFQEALKEVRISKRLAESPCCLVASEGDMGRNLEQILMRGGRKVAEAKPILEVNPDHAFVKKLAQQVKETPFAEEVNERCDLLLDLAYLGQGSVRRPGQMVSAIASLLTKQG